MWGSQEENPEKVRRLGAGVATGLAIALAIGLALENIAIGIPIGAAIGAGILVWWDRHSKMNDGAGQNKRSSGLW